MTKPKYTTFTGVRAEDIPAKLIERFPPEAYKGVPGGADLTDINTGFMIQRVTEIFGPKGLGWNLLYNPSDMVTTGDAGRTVARLNATFLYSLWSETGEKLDCAFPVSGTNQNDFKYIDEGVVTTCMGRALKWLCFQNDIYKGVWDHHDAEKEKRAASGAPSGTTGTGTSSATQGTNGAAKTGAKPAAAAAPTDNAEQASADWEGVKKYQTLFGQAVQLGIKAESITPGKITKGEVRAKYGELAKQVETAQAAAH